jgi:protein ImuB
MSLWLPSWATDVVRRRLRLAESAPADAADPRAAPRLCKGGPRTAILLTQRQRAREIVVRRCAVAAACGIGPGMDLAHAQSLLPGRVRAHVEEHRPEVEAAALRRLAAWMIRFSPTVAVDPPDGLLLDATGLSRHYPSSGEAGLAGAIGQVLTRRGFAVRIAIAPTYACAQAVVRCAASPLTCVPEGGAKAAIEGLPVEALRPEPPLLDALREVGLTRVGQLLDLPRAALAAQFGEALQRQLDRALGLAPETIDAVRPEPPPRASLVFDGPTDRWESIEAATHEVLSSLLADLLARGRCARRMDLELRHPDGTTTTRSVQLSRPSQSVRHWWAMLRPVLERIDLQPGVEGVAITASGLTAQQGKQTALGGFDEQADGAFDEASWAETIDTLVSRFGADNVLRYEPVPSHIPHRAYRARPAVPPAEATASLATSAAAGRAGGKKRAAAAHTAALATSTAAAPLVTPAARPTRLFECPLAAAVTLQTPDGPILHVSWAGRKQKVIAFRGPERIGGEWWRRDCPAEDVARMDYDYFAVQTEDGAWLWLGRSVETGRWCVQGDWA